MDTTHKTPIHTTNLPILPPRTFHHPHFTSIDPFSPHCMEDGVLLNISHCSRLLGGDGLHDHFMDAVVMQIERLHGWNYHDSHYTLLACITYQTLLKVSPHQEILFGKKVSKLFGSRFLKLFGNIWETLFLVHTRKHCLAVVFPV